MGWGEVVRVGVALLVVVLLAGCSGPAPRGRQVDTSVIPAAVARRDLLAAIPEHTAYAFRIAGVGAPVSGVFSGVDSALQVSAQKAVPGRNARMTVTARRVGSPVWVRVALEPASWHGRLGVPTGWMALDRDRMPAEKLFPILVDGDGGDVAEIRDVVRFATVVRETAPGRYAGTVDLRTLDRSDSIVPRAVVDGLGERAAEVPFEVSVTGGAVSGMTMTVPGGTGYQVEYTEIGRAEAPGALTARPAPKSFYALLGG